MLSEGEDDESFYIPIAPDEYFKEGAGGGGPYAIALGNGAIDAPLVWEWHEITFVNYLRISFRWGGMPGLERCSQPPKKDVAYLIEGFLPI